jgi:hypothetical protein
VSEDPAVLPPLDFPSPFWDVTSQVRFRTKNVLKREPKTFCENLLASETSFFGSETPLDFPSPFWDVTSQVRFRTKKSPFGF